MQLVTDLRVPQCLPFVSHILVHPRVKSGIWNWRVAIVRLGRYAVADLVASLTRFGIQYQWVAEISILDGFQSQQSHKELECFQGQTTLK
jgi:hypothetical protein